MPRSRQWYPVRVLACLKRDLYFQRQKEYLCDPMVARRDANCRIDACTSPERRCAWKRHAEGWTPRPGLYHREDNVLTWRNYTDARINMNEKWLPLRNLITAQLGQLKCCCCHYYKQERQFHFCLNEYCVRLLCYATSQENDTESKREFVSIWLMSKKKQV